MAVVAWRCTTSETDEKIPYDKKLDKVVEHLKEDVS